MADPAKPHIVIHVDDGMIQSVFCTEHASYEILDTDREFSETADADESRLAEIIADHRYCEL